MGDKEAADQAAVDGMHTVLDVVHMDGVVVIGEGEKDEAPMLHNGERVGDGSPPQVDIAVDPVEGTRPTTLGMPNALAVIALAERGVLSAAALRCLGGLLAGRLYPRNDEERRAALEAGYDLDRILTQDHVCKGEDVFFSTTGVTDGDVLQGVGYEGVNGATTESLVMRTREASNRATIARRFAS
jgi:fructose-1,6-bisphosphatase/sedoheptulose 1,7-bisphosphatase-like protein